MKLIINRITAEFNKIFTGSKRVGDSLKLEGKRMSELDVLNASKLGYKTESALNVNHSITSDKSMKLASTDINGNPVVDSNGNQIYIKENQFRVSNSQFLRDVAPLNLEVDIARRLKVGDQTNSPVINVSNLIIDAALYRVKDSGLLGGKTESQLSVLTARSADNATLLNNKPANQLTVEKSRISSLLISDIDNVERKESELKVFSTATIRKGTDNLDIYALRNYLFSTNEARDVVVNLSSSSNTITTASGNKSFIDIMTYIKDDVSSEAYKAKRLITVDGVKNGDDYKTWVIEHNDFKVKVAKLNSQTSDRAVRFGSDSDNYNITEMLAKIKTITVDLALNSNKLQNQTVDDIISTTRSQILTNASNGTTGLVQNEVDGFFGNNKVKNAVKAIEVTRANDSNLLNGSTLTQIKDSIKNDGGVYSSKYIYMDPINGGLKSYIDITNDILAAKTSLIDNATEAYSTLGKVEKIIIDNKTSNDSAISTEKTRIDTILNNAADDTNTFSKVKVYIDGLYNSLSTDSTDINNKIITEKTRIDTILNNAADDTNTFSKVKVYVDDLYNKLLNPNKLPVKYETINVPVTTSGESHDMQYRYTISGKILTYENSMVFVNGIKLRKHTGTYIFTQSDSDTILTISDENKLSTTDDIIEIETLVLA